jgi:hypothetical protein
MTIEELLKPRYKVINGYPRSPFEVGVVLVVAEDGELYSIEHGYFPSSTIVREEEAKQYPNIFRSLQWWEGREIAGMYVRFGEKDTVHSYYQLKEPLEGGVYGFWMMQGNLDEYCYPLNGCHPATEQEYLEFINTKPKHWYEN